jgi:hypothetical protein
MIRQLLALTVLSAAVLLPSSIRAEAWEERMWRQVNMKVSFELVDTKLTEACDFMSHLTGLNIILAPSVRQNDPVLSLRVRDMDAGTAIKWFTQLTDTYADLVDHAVFITDKPPKQAAEAERDGLLALGAAHGVAVDVPPAGQPLTDQDRIKIALQIIEKEQIKLQDFPGPDVSLGTAAGTGINFGNK